MAAVHLRQALFRPQAFDVTSRTPGDQSMIGQLYPPYRQNYGFGGGGIAMNAAGGMGIGKVGMKLGSATSALEAYLLGTKTAAEEEAWRREHSAGAFFKNLAKTAVGGTVSAFTGGIAQSVGSGMADMILRKRFDGFKPSGEYDRRYNDSSNN